MKHDLHDLLEGAADLSGPADFDADALWRQATRTKRRHHVMTALGVLGVVALVSGTVWWGGIAPQPGSVAPPAGRVTTPAMPSHIYAVPSDVEPTSSRLDIGPVAAAIVTSGGDPVAVSALDGSYHPLRLPGYDDVLARILQPVPTVAVAPDGASLAYAWHDEPPTSGASHVMSGLRIVDLETGDVSTYPVPGGVAALCGGLSWSSSGRYLGYSCWIESRFDASGSRGQVLRVERLDTSTGRRAVAPGPSSARERIAVADDGTLVYPNGEVLVTWGPWLHRGDERTSQGVSFSPRSVAWLNRSVLLAVSDLGTSLRGFQSRPTDGVFYFPPVTLPGVAILVGSVQSGQVALVITHRHYAELATYDVEMGLVPRVRIDQVSPDAAFSFATDLLEKALRDTGEPNWKTDWRPGPWSVGGAVAILTIALAFFAWLWRRRARAMTV